MAATSGAKPGCFQDPIARFQSSSNAIVSGAAGRSHFRQRTRSGRDGLPEISRCALTILSASAPRLWGAHLVLRSLTQLKLRGARRTPPRVGLLARQHRMPRRNSWLEGPERIRNGGVALANIDVALLAVPPDQGPLCWGSCPNWSRASQAEWED